jgi:hypothetical protein
MTRQLSTEAPSVLIRTLPLLAGNYGGILQAFALQAYLRDFGVRAVTDSAVEYRSTFRTPVGTALALAKGRLDQRLTPTMRNTVNRNLVAFVRENMETVDDVVATGPSRREILGSVSVAITGSDQVWRREYADVRRYLFADLDEPGPRKIAYAASFGKDDLDEYSPQLVEQTALLAQRFSALSVREDSGVDLCREHWSMTAERHVDPVFLLDASRYRDLAGRGAHAAGQVGPDRKSVFAYVLDASEEKTALLERIAAQLRLPLQRFPVSEHGSRRVMRANPEAQVRPSMQSWLSSFRDAQFVVTDSFHGAAMSILLNKPYIALTNRDRGAARFVTLHRTFGLEDRLVSEIHDSLPAAVATPVDWERVNQAIEDERVRSLGYLAEHVPGMATPVPLTRHPGSN